MQELQLNQMHLEDSSLNTKASFMQEEESEGEPMLNFRIRIKSPMYTLHQNIKQVQFGLQKLRGRFEFLGRSRQAQNKAILLKSQVDDFCDKIIAFHNQLTETGTNDQIEQDMKISTDLLKEYYQIITDIDAAYKNKRNKNGQPLTSTNLQQDTNRHLKRSRRN